MPTLMRLRRSRHSSVRDAGARRRADPAAPAAARPLSLVTLVAGLTLAVSPGSAADGTLRSAKSHVHGIGKLSIVLDGAGLNMLLETPVFNLIGVEQAPATARERQAWAQALTTLREQGERLLRPNAAARCMLVDAELEDPFASDHAQQMQAAHHHEHAHEPDHGEGDEHDEPAEPEPEPAAPATDAHDATAHAHDDPSHARAPAHADLHVRYRFDCERAARLREIEVDLFAAFPGLERLDAIYLDRRRQTAATLTASDPRFRLE